ncbi:ParB/RepB/Spo0J family partition protein [Staphylococcus devriesei]|uniref:ParB/RepB/Spo0J family partition protein n=1 Tax=Staphylococcus devriesei TaxID=586733 RepID=UPI0026746CC6|nr:ParB/RepB/Spo0J family partition protein [Staphylococcus devriesei]WKU12571.1 ParB/RepB/Spo0J family partition protein [Staphylococcus devriesei]
MKYEKDERLQPKQHEQIQKITITDIKANPYQPRKTFDETRLNELADSIKQHGILQPIVLRKNVQGYYIVVGERRFRASQIAGLQKVPAIVKDLSDANMMELAIIENLQRENLNVIEEAESYRRLMDDLGLTQQEVAKRLGKSRPYIANMLRLLNLPKEVSQFVKEGKLSGAHGRTLLGIKDNETMREVSKQAISENWSVRYLENIVNELQDGRQSKNEKKQPVLKPKFIQKQERILKEKYGTRVDISAGRKIGKITFEFGSEDEFRMLINKLNEK